MQWCNNIKKYFLKNAAFYICKMVVKYGSYSFDNDRRVFLIVEFSTEKSQASSRSRVKLASALRNRRQIALMHSVDKRDLTQQDGWRSQDDRMTEEMLGEIVDFRSCATFFRHLPSWIFQPSCCIKLAKLITVVCGGSCFHSLSENRHSSVFSLDRGEDNSRLNFLATTTIQTWLIYKECTPGASTSSVRMRLHA